MEMNNLQDLLMDELRDIYSAEKQILKALPKMAKKASNPDLKAAFEEHLGADRGARRPAGTDLRPARQEADGQDLCRR